MLKKTVLGIFVCTLPWPAVAGTLYVSDLTQFTVQTFNSSTGALTGSLTPTGGWGAPAGIAIGSNGDVYVADNQNNVVDQFAPNGAFLAAFISSGLNAPTGLAFGPDGNLYVANFGPGNNSYVARYDASGNPVDATPFVPSSTGLFDPQSIAFGPDGNLYIADSSNDAIDKVLLSPGTFNTLVPAGCPGTPFTNPSGLTFGPNGNIFVADEGFGCGANTGSGIYEYTKAGSFVINFVTPNFLSSPIGIAFGSDGNLYATDSQGRVAEFNGTTGAYMTDFIASNGSAGPLINPTFLTFATPASVPEPSSAALIGIGVLGIAWIKLRRRRIAALG